MTFDELCQRATGHGAYEYQRRIADEGLPELLRVPTGGGKTLAAVLGWLYRRRFHPDPDVRAATPRWLVFVLPMRVLVEQTNDVIEQWLGNIGVADDVGLHRIMGGDGRVDRSWREDPARDTILVGTLDMLLSRALNRGYAESRWVWPVDFGLLNNGTQWVFDEVQLMGVGLPTSRQLEGLRRALGTAVPTRSMWMSATVDEQSLSTPDLPGVEVILEVSDADRVGSLAVRLGAPKTVQRLGIDLADPATLAEVLDQRHRPGTRTLAMLNTVDRATALYQALRRRSEVPTVLVHSRFRPRERVTHLATALAQPDPHGPGQIVVSTQVLEAGVDISATTMFTEAAPWSSVVQRAGRCNRSGDDQDAVLLWGAPPKPGPYEEADIESAADALARLDGQVVTPESLQSQVVAVGSPILPVLRRRDLVDLFDTTPDLSGNDVDVSRFIRVGDDLDAHIVWWDVEPQGPEPTRLLPARDERCPVPVGAIRKYLAGKDRRAWRLDHLADDRRWTTCRAGEVHPGAVVILPAANGGYHIEHGWAPASRLPVPIVDQGETSDDPLADADETTGDDPVTFRRHWLSLLRHLEDVEAEAGALLGRLGPLGISDSARNAVIAAARLHDIGKAHACFQQMLLDNATGDEHELAAAHAAGEPLAKSGGPHRSRNKRPHFRHELASALALLGDAKGALDDLVEADLVVYLVAAHHGRVRLGFRSLPGETKPGEASTALGVMTGDSLPEIDIPGGRLPEARLDLSTMGLGAPRDGERSWSGRMLLLRDRPDIGPFRLGLMEAVVRLADWRASPVFRTFGWKVEA